MHFAVYTKTPAIMGEPLMPQGLERESGVKSKHAADLGSISDIFSVLPNSARSDL